MKGLMKIKLIRVIARDQEHALGFYTEVLGFIKKTEFPVGDHKWLTVVSPEEPDGTELLLEPNGEHPPTKAYKKAIYEEGLPLTAFLVDDIESEYARLREAGVEFRSEPQRFGDEVMATFDDTCGNLIMIYQVGGEP